MAAQWRRATTPAQWLGRTIRRLLWWGPFFLLTGYPAGLSAQPLDVSPVTSGCNASPTTAPGDRPGPLCPPPANENSVVAEEDQDDTPDADDDDDDSADNDADCEEGMPVIGQTCLHPENQLRSQTNLSPAPIICPFKARPPPEAKLTTLLCFSEIPPSVLRLNCLGLFPTGPVLSEAFPPALPQGFASTPVVRIKNNPTQRSP